MKIKLLFLFALFSSIIFSQTPKEYNNRAFEELNRDPSVALYYCDASIDSNFETKDLIEYIRSLFYKSLIYKNLEMEAERLTFLEESYKVNSSNSFIYTDMDYIKELFNYYLIKDITIVENILNSSIPDNLDQKSLIEFRILDFTKDLFLNKDVSSKFSQLVAATGSFGYRDLESEIYLILGKSYLDSDLDTAMSLFNKVLDLNEEEYLTDAYIERANILIARGNNYQAQLDLNKAYLNAQLISNDPITASVAESLAKLHRTRGNFKNTSSLLNSLLEIRERRSAFLLKERGEIFKEDYEKRSLREDFRKSSFLVSILIYIVIGLSVALICLVVFLSIQTYRLRHLKLGKN